MPIEALGHLKDALAERAHDELDLQNVAFGIDSSVMLRLAGHTKHADIIDYLDSQHAGPLIIPSQSVQEFWNNQLSAVQTVAQSVRKKYQELEDEIAKLEDITSDLSVQISNVLHELQDKYGHIYDESTVRNTQTVIDMLQRRASLSQVPRSRFHQIAELRSATKTPPGYKDHGHGDFFIWAEFLLGLVHARDQGSQYCHAVMLSYDQKPDWSRSGVPHPILAAEVGKLVNASFRIWTLDKLAAAIDRQGSASE